jgi:hypothetical protein
MIFSNPERALRFGLRSGFRLADALLEAIFAAVAATIQFLGAFSFLMAHDVLPEEDIFQAPHI